MKPKILTALKVSLLAIAASSLSACFSHSYYGPPAYASGPTYVAPYRPAPVYYPPTYSYAPPTNRPDYRYDGGGRAWVEHEHELHEAHEAQEHHDEH